MAEIKLYYGDEPYRLMERKEALKKVEYPEMNLYLTDGFDQEAYEYAFQLPFLAKEKTIIVNLETCSGTELLLEYMQNPVSSTNLYLFVRQMDMRSTLAKNFPKESLVEYPKYTSQELDEKIITYVQKCGKKIPQGVLRAVKEKLQYDNEEVSFFDVRNELSKLCAVSDDIISMESVDELVSVNETENVFALMQMILDHKAGQLFHEAELILENRNNVIQVLSLLLRNYRIAWKASFLGMEREKDIGVHPRAIIHLPCEVCINSMDYIQDAISGIKGGRYKERDGFFICLSRLMDCVKITAKSS